MTYAPDGWDDSSRAARAMPDLASTGWTSTAGASCSPRTPACPASSRCRWSHAARRRHARARVDCARTPAPTTCRISIRGRGWRELPRGTIKKLRVVALDFRPAGHRLQRQRRTRRRRADQHAGVDRQRRLGCETRARRDHGARGRLGLLHRAGPHAGLFPGAGRARPGGADDAQLEHAATGRKRLLRRLPRVKEQRAARPRIWHHAGDETTAAQTGAVLRPGARASVSPRKSSRSWTATASAVTANANRCWPWLAARAGPCSIERPEVRSRGRDRAFSLLGENVPDRIAGRDWSDAYLVLTQAKRDGKDGCLPWPARRAAGQLDQLAIGADSPAAGIGRLHQERIV